MHFKVRVTTEPLEDSINFQGEGGEGGGYQYRGGKGNHFKCLIELLQGFQFGFRLGYKCPTLGVYSKIFKSVLQFPDIFKEKIISELKFGRLSGPLLNKPIYNQ